MTQHRQAYPQLPGLLHEPHLGTSNPKPKLHKICRITNNLRSRLSNPGSIPCNYEPTLCSQFSISLPKIRPITFHPFYDRTLHSCILGATHPMTSNSMFPFALHPILTAEELNIPRNIALTFATTVPKLKLIHLCTYCEGANNYHGMQIGAKNYYIRNQVHVNQN